jgi:hypothetical protein
MTALALAAWPLLAAMAGHEHGAVSAPGLNVPMVVAAGDGTLWRAWVDGPHVWVGRSSDRGRTFEGTVRVNPEPERIDANGEARPKIALGPDGEIFVSYTRRQETGYVGDVHFARSVDGGRTFSTPMSLLDEGMTSGRFDTLTVGPEGDVHVFWIGRAGSNVSSLVHKVSTDRGRTFSPARMVKDDICECCRLALAWDGAQPVVFWRDMIPGGCRDHSLARITGGEKAPAVVRATDDDWEIAACPHQGPSVAVSDGVTHLAWFTGDGRRGAGSFYRRTTDGGRTFSEPVRVGGATAMRPQLLARERRVWLVWKEATKGGGTAVLAMRSSDAGATWSAAREVAHTKGGSDHPLLVAAGPDVLLSWLSDDEGHRLLALE